MICPLHDIMGLPDMDILPSVIYIDYTGGPFDITWHGNSFIRSPPWTSTRRSRVIPRVRQLMPQEAMSGKVGTNQTVSPSDLEQQVVWGTRQGTDQKIVFQHLRERIPYHRLQSRRSQPLVLVRTRVVAGVTPQVQFYIFSQRVLDENKRDSNQCSCCCFFNILILLS